MKKIVLLLMFLFAVTTNAQEKIIDGLMFDNEYEWMFCGSKTNSIHTVFYEYCRFDGTTEKNGKTYHVLTFKRVFLDGSTGNRPNGYHDQDAKGSLCVRTEGGLVYADREDYMKLMSDDSYWRWVGDRDHIPYPQTNDGEIVLYNFNMNVGDQFNTVEGHEAISVVEINNIVTKDGVARKLFILSNGCQIIEGIGCVNSPGMWLFYLNPGASPYDIGYLLFYGYHPQGTGTWNAIYEREEETNSIYNMTTGSDVKVPSFYDLQGRRLTGKPTKGIYIQNGKKVVIK